MFVELSVNPVGTNTDVRGAIDEALKVIDASGLQYQPTPFGACVEGEWDDVMSIVQVCHKQLRETESRLITIVRMGVYGNVD